MGFQKKQVSGRSEDLDFFYRRVSREPPLNENKPFWIIFQVPIWVWLAI
jgi:hypothetical protein